jgi:hypothetical protein
MRRYRNLSGQSGVWAFAIGEGSVTVRFSTGATYLYNEAVTGADAIAEMTRLAEAGRGLATYITQHVQDRYAARLD